MDLNSHRRILGIIHLVTGSLNLLLFMGISLLATGLMPLIEEAIRESQGRDIAEISDVIIMGIRFIVFLVIAVISLPSIIGGMALLDGRNWGYALVLVTGCLSLFSFPIGTAKGVYTIWVFIEYNNQKSNVKN